MRFRITHLLIAGAIVAVFAASLSDAPHFWPYLSFAAWAAFTVLACKAVCSRGPSRLVLLCSLIFGLSYLGFAFSFTGQLPTLILPHKLYDAMYRPPEPVTLEQFMNNGGYEQFMAIWHLAFSFLFAALGGALGAYWLRTNPKE